MELIIASNNQHKIKEFRRMLEPLGIEIISQKEAGVKLEVEETGETFEENARLKAKGFFDLCNKAVIADDSGLEVDFLGGAPGVYSARYAGEGASDKACYQKLLKEMEDVGLDNRTARFVCVIHLIMPNGDEYSFRGTCEGYIGYEPLGDNGFGYDPIFMVGDTSFSELEPDEKDNISHRGQALKKLYSFFEENNER